MPTDLRDKVVLITGASTGIGAAAALAFAREGSRVIIHYNASSDAAARVAAEVKTLGAEAALVGGDVMQSGVVKRIVADALAAFGRVDILINNAGGLVARTTIQN
jgi:3-oxoacyl-[acyl-carrier protein] reductase